jgi:rubrerythrin
VNTEGKKFKRTTEDFVCENCDTNVKGNGYTNHCPVCLYSKHVDINPGDRAALCGGLMKPVAVSKKDDKYILLHRCVKCGYEKNNKTAPEDDFENILKV